MASGLALYNSLPLVSMLSLSLPSCPFFALKLEASVGQKDQADHGTSRLKILHWLISHCSQDKVSKALNDLPCQPHTANFSPFLMPSQLLLLVTPTPRTRTGDAISLHATSPPSPPLAAVAVVGTSSARHHVLPPASTSRACWGSLIFRLHPPSLWKDSSEAYSFQFFREFLRMDPWLPSNVPIPHPHWLSLFPPTPSDHHPNKLSAPRSLPQALFSGDPNQETSSLTQTGVDAPAFLWFCVIIVCLCVHLPCVSVS